jgi:hypothetical protein
MTTRALTITVLDIFYEDKTSEITGFTKRELASFKRTKKYKKVLTKKKLCEIEVKIKTP